MRISQNRLVYKWWQSQVTGSLFLLLDGELDGYWCIYYWLAWYKRLICPTCLLCSESITLYEAMYSTGTIILPLWKSANYWPSLSPTCSMSSPTYSDFVKNILEGGKRCLSVPIKKKDSITRDLLSNMYDKMFCDKNLYTERTISACLLAYSGFLKVSELLNIQSCDILLYQSHMSVFIQKVKPISTEMVIE